MSLITEKFALTEKELVELQYMGYLGFKYIARNEIGSLCFFKEKPVRDKETNGNRGGYDLWVIGSLPVKDHSLYGEVKLGKYEFIAWERGLFEVDMLIRHHEYMSKCELCVECDGYDILNEEGKCGACAE